MCSEPAKEIDNVHILELLLAALGVIIAARKLKRKEQRIKALSLADIDVARKLRWSEQWIKAPPSSSLS